jgi:hypothetical protein
VPPPPGLGLYLMPTHRFRGGLISFASARLGRWKFVLFRIG